MQKKQTFQTALKECYDDLTKVRNVCVIAHVDHGKTTFTDSLLSSNNIISEALAGDVRYMDSRADEQERGITLKSSSICQFHEYNNSWNLMNQIDSPGHVEFSFEVSTGLRVVDGAFVLVDAVEGVLAQTYTSLNKAMEEGLPCILVQNKVDKLITDLNLEPYDAYQQLSDILSATNAVLSSFIKLKIVKMTGSEEIEETILEEYEKKYQFDPVKGNVIFSSAFHGWGFTLDSFAKYLAENTPFGFKAEVLKKCLWGEYYFNPKAEKAKDKITKKPKNESHLPMFAALVLQSIYPIYNLIADGDMKKLDARCSKMGIKYNKFFADKKDKNPLIKDIMRQWMPQHKAAFSTSIESLPSPIESQKDRIYYIFKKLRNKNELVERKISENISKKMSENIERKMSNEDPNILRKNSTELAQVYDYVKKNEEIINSIEKATKDGPMVAFVSKMVHIRKSNIAEGNLPNSHEHLDKNDLLLFGFARIFSGTLSRGDKIFTITPKKKSEKNAEEAQDQNQKDNVKFEVTEVQVDHLYIWMGQFLKPVDKVLPGSIVAIGDIGHVGFKTATLSSVKQCPSLNKINFDQNMMKVTLTPNNIEDTEKLAQGLVKLNKADPSIETYYNENGEIVLEVSGEIHLERCLNDLIEDYAQVEITKSDPIMSFKETILTEKFRLRKIVKKKSFEEIDKNEVEQKNENGKTEEENKQVEPVQEEKLEVDDKTSVQDEIKETKEFDANDKKEGEWWYDDWSSFEEPSVSEEENEDFVKKDKQEVIEEKLEPQDFEDHDDGTKKEDHEDCNFKSQTYNFMYENIGLASKNVIKKSKGLKVKNNDFVDIKGKKNFIELNTPNGQYTLCVRAVSMPYEFANWLLNKEPLIKKLFYGSKKDSFEYKKFFNDMLHQMREVKMHKSLIQLVLRYFITFGPKKSGPNMLLCMFARETSNLFYKYSDKVEYDKIKKLIGDIEKIQNLTSLNFEDTDFIAEYYESYKEADIIKSIENGFELSQNEGPLCAEPMFGCIFIIEDFVSTKYQEYLVNTANKPKTPEKQKNKLDLPDDSEKLLINPEENLDAVLDSESKIKTNTGEVRKIEKIDNNGPLTTQLLGVMKEACKETFLGGNPRLVEGYYKCTIYTPLDCFGKVNDVLSKKRGKIIENDYQELTDLYVIISIIPICESYGFANQMRTETSGRITPHIEFYNWAILEEDPFYVPVTKEDQEEHGDEGTVKRNFAKQIIDKTRKRKGLILDIKVVVDGSKQSTIKKAT